MVKIAICDDDIDVAKEIEKLINSMDEIERYDISIFDNGNDFLSSNYNTYDMAFLDIEIGDMTGIDIAEKLRKANEFAIIFFITSYSSYISEAFKSMPFQYFVKPISNNEKLFKAEFLRGLKALKKLKFLLTIKTLYGKESINISLIKYVECINRKTEIHLIDRVIYSTGHLNELEELLIEHNFVQCQKSFLVNLHYVKQIKNNEIIMVDNKCIPIGRKYLPEVRKVRNKYIVAMD